MTGRMRRAMVGVVAAGLSLCFACGIASAAAAAKAKRAGAPPSVGRLSFLGTVNLAATARSNAASPSAAHFFSRVGSPLRPKSAPRTAKAAPKPRTSDRLALSTPALGFLGLTAANSSAVNGFPVEPPDQGLCAHNGVILESVNLAARVYTTAGAPLTPTISLNQFFGLAPAVSGSGDAATFGPFISDPRCYYDAQTGRWFMTALEIDVNPSTGALGDRSSELIAVSQSSDPTGSYGLFSVDTTNNGTGGTPAEPHCPCFGDQPRIGADAHGFYISTDSYPIDGSFNSNGGELYAISKQGLAAAATGSTPPLSLVAIHIGAVLIGHFPANAVQPAETPQGGSYAADREYFLSTPDFNGFATMGGAGAKSVVLWTLSNTSTLSSATPALTLTDAILPSERYTPPVNATQKPGPFPLGDSLGAPLAPISVNDDRMQQVEYVGGNLYSALNTGIGGSSRDRPSGIAWFRVTPSATNGTVTSQGYLAAGKGASLMYPAIGLDTTGRGVMTFSVSGPTIYPSAAYVPFSGRPTTETITVVGSGVGPEDGFTCYEAEGFGPACRWGDYSAASSDGSGHVVMGDEMIPAADRDPLANWGTFITTLTP